MVLGVYYRTAEKEINRFLDPGRLTLSQPGAFQEGEIKKEENKIVHQARSCEFTDVMLLVSLLRKILTVPFLFLS